MGGALVVKERNRGTPKLGLLRAFEPASETSQLTQNYKGQLQYCKADKLQQ